MEAEKFDSQESKDEIQKRLNDAKVDINKAQQWDEHKWKEEIHERMKSTMAVNMTVREFAALSIYNGLISNPTYIKKVLAEEDCASTLEEALQYAIYDAETFSRRLFEHLDESQ